MTSVTELSCLLSGALDAAAPDADHVEALLNQLVELLHHSPEAAAELDELLFDLHQALMRAAGTSAAAEGRVLQLLEVAANKCTAREVFTLCMATLSQELSSWSADAADASTSHGPTSPAFQLSLLSTLCRCLLRIKRRPLHFLAELLHMQLRWAAEVLPSLPLGDPALVHSVDMGSASSSAHAGSSGSGESGSGSCGQPSAHPHPLTVALATASLAHSAVSTADWAQHAEQLSSQDRQLAQKLQATALLQLASIIVQLPQVSAAAGMALPAHGSAVAMAAPTIGSRLPLMQVAAEAVVQLPRLLLQQLPAVAGGSSPEELWQAAAVATEQLAASGLDPSDLSYFSATEAAEGAAVAACAALVATEPAATATAAPPPLLTSRLRQLLPEAARLLLDLGAHHQSVPLTLLPLCALSQACRQLASSSATSNECQLAASSPALDALFAALVAVMSHNPVQLIRSCTHDALQALLDAFQPAARLAQLKSLMQMPSTAAAVVALQRLRQEMAAAWCSQQLEPAGGSAQPDGNHINDDGGSGKGSSSRATLWLSPGVLQLALLCLEHGTEAGWHDGGSVLHKADVQAAALSLLRWVLLREAAAPRGMLPPQQARHLLQHDLLPLQACVVRLLQMQSSSMGGGGGGGSGSGSSGAALEQQQLLDSFLAVQRLHEALDCVIDLIQPARS